MSAKPWFPFFPSDWKGKNSLRLCTPGARLLWLEMLCVMHEAEPRGYLRLNGKPVSNPQIAMLSALPLVDVNTWVAELEESEVFSRDADGTIYSRKMVRDSKKSQEQADRVAKRWSGNTVGNTETDTGSIPQIPKPHPYPEQEFRKRGKPLLGAAQDFDAFWAAYPNKKAKPVALKAFLKAKSSGANIRAVMDGLERAKRSDQWIKDGGRFIPHPASWLNAARWEDQGPENEPDPPGTRRLDNGHLFNPNAFV